MGEGIKSKITAPFKNKMLEGKMNSYKWQQLLLMAFKCANNNQYSLYKLEEDTIIFNRNLNNTFERIEVRLNMDNGKNGVITKTKTLSDRSIKDCGSITVKLKSTAWCDDWFWLEIFKPTESGGQPRDEITMDSIHLAML